MLPLDDAMIDHEQRREDGPLNTAQEGARRSLLWRKLRVDGVLIFVTMIWGSTFLLTKYTIQFTGPFTYLAYCFAIGALILAGVFRRRLAHLTRVELRSGLVMGCLLFAGYALQTVGLQYTITSKAAFITGLYIPLVPVFSIIFLRNRLSKEAMIGVVLSALGLLLLSINKDFNLVFGLGELLLLGCAFAFALHIVCISKFVPHADAINLVIVQLCLTSVLSFIIAPLSHESLLLPPSWQIWGALIFMGVADFAFCLTAMNWAQQFISSTRATLIYACEPVWAGLIGTLVGQSLSLPAWIGGACICLGMIVSEIRLSARWKGGRERHG